jgi:hypothetical protein
MNGSLNAALSGAVAMASLTAALFFLRFWRHTADTFFLLFFFAFSIDAVSRFALALASVTKEMEPLLYLPRLVMFGLIIMAIVIKNRPDR